jgi:hypothetical protein
MADHGNEPTWHQSTRCGTNACVQVGRVGDQFLMRDAKDADGARLVFDVKDWAAFLDEVRSGRLGRID